MRVEGQVFNVKSEKDNCLKDQFNQPIKEIQKELAIKDEYIERFLFNKFNHNILEAKKIRQKNWKSIIHYQLQFYSKREKILILPKKIQKLMSKIHTLKN